MHVIILNFYIITHFLDSYCMCFRKAQHFNSIIGDTPSLSLCFYFAGGIMTVRGIIQIVTRGGQKKNVKNVAASNGRYINIRNTK